MEPGQRVTNDDIHAAAELIADVYKQAIEDNNQDAILSSIDEDDDDVEQDIEAYIDNLEAELVKSQADTVLHRNKVNQLEKDWWELTKQHIELSKDFRELLSIFNRRVQK